MQRLDAAWNRARGGALRPMIGRAGLSLAMFRGDETAAATWRARSGCVRAATVAGPLHWAALGQLSAPLALETPSTPFPSSWPGLPPFGADARPQIVEADGCELGTRGASAAVGLRVAAVDVESSAERPLWIGLTSTSAAVVSVGGTTVLQRPFHAGPSRVTRMARVEVGAGRARIVVKVAQRDDGDSVVLTVADGEGRPVATKAPSPGDVAPARGSDVGAVGMEVPGAGADALMLAASARMAMGDGRDAERLLEGFARDPGASGLALLSYARALSVGSAMPETRRIERQREAYGRAIAAMPRSWEAALGVATLAGQRKGGNEGRIESLAELEKLRGRGLPPHANLDAFEAHVAAAAGMQDRAQAAWQRLQASTAPAPMERRIDRLVHRRTGQELVAASCSADADRGALGCFEAHVAKGDTRGALDEIGRMRRLLGSPRALGELELAQWVARGDAAKVLEVYDAIEPWRRSAAALGLIARSRPEEARQRLARDLPVMVDGPGAAQALYSVLGACEAGFDDGGEKRVAEDRAKPAMKEAATLVLDHSEKYTIGERGELFYTIHDLRRVAGTTDVEQGAEGGVATIEGRSAHQVMRKRIHKKDGRILEPDQARQAAQGHADLSQLEQGDYVELLVSGVALPGNMGQLVVDTPDLLPARTSVLHASVQVRFPKNVALHRWAHRSLGKGVEREDGPQKVWTVELDKRGPRRIESGIPKMEQEVNVSFGTQTWANVARGIRESTLALEAADPVVGAFARSAVGDTTGDKALERIVSAVGRKVRVASGAALSDSAGAFASGAQETTARTILELGQGSRTWLASQALAHLGFTSEVVVAESEPFASDPTFPAHVGRFEHPLLVVRVPSSGATTETWLDLDVQGPPLPPGKVSPELRGRSAIRSSGEVVTVPAGSESGPDEVDMRLTVDDRGDAKGTVTLLLRGRAAQVLLDAFEELAGSDRKDMLRSVVLGWIPWANVDDVVTSSAEGSWELGVRASVSVPGFAQPEGGAYVLAGVAPLHAVVPQPVSTTIASTYAGQGAREDALAIETSWHYHLRRRIELPAGWTVAGVPGGVKVQERQLQAERRVEARGTVVEEDFTLSIPTGTVDAAEFEQFASRARQVDDGFLCGIRVKGPAGR